jgi:GNAT superfamily N-acetyltransferase
MAGTAIAIRQVSTKADRTAFVELPYRLYANDPNWVPPLRRDIYELLTPGKNPWYEHGEQQMFLAERNGKAVGRISAHIDYLAIAQPPEQGMGTGVGNWGLFDGEDVEAFIALIAAAEAWLRAKGMTRSLGPLSISIWDEPGLLVQGAEHPATVMMGHDNPAYQSWVEGAGYTKVKDLYTYEIPIDIPFPPLVERIVQSAERSERMVIRRVDKSRFDEEAATILAILNDAWSDNWGFVPITDSEIAYIGKKLKPIIYEDLVRIVEIDGEPTAFMMTWPDINEKIATFNGNLFPFNWAKLLWWLRKPKVTTMRVPLMGVLQKMQGTRAASQMAFALVEYIRRDAVSKFGASRGEFGWVLDDNGPMRSVAEAINGRINKTYRIYEKNL